MLRLTALVWAPALVAVLAVTLPVVASVALFLAAVFAVGPAVLFLSERPERPKRPAWTYEPVVDCTASDIRMRRLLMDDTITTEQYVEAVEHGNMPRLAPRSASPPGRSSTEELRRRYLSHSTLRQMENEGLAQQNSLTEPGTSVMLHSTRTEEEYYYD